MNLSLKDHDFNTSGNLSCIFARQDIFCSFVITGTAINRGNILHCEIIKVLYI